MNHCKLNILSILCIMSIPYQIAARNKITEEQPITVTLNQAEEFMLKHYPLLRSKDYDILAREAQLTQNKLYDNPAINTTYNVYNPDGKRYFDWSHNGEIQLQVEQSIPIGGQHQEKVRESEAMVESSKYTRKDTERQLLEQLDSRLVELFYLQKENHVYEKENQSLEKILKAYHEQVEKGNIPAIEAQRIESLHFQLLKEQQELITSEKDLQKNIQLLTGLPEDKDIVPVINEQKIIYSLSDLSNLRELLSLAQSRPDVVAQGLGIQASEHEVKLQKANALPQVSLQGGYDENGFAIGVGVSIPIFNHNQGNIRAAEIQTQQAMLQQEMNKQQMKADIRQDYNQLFLDKKIVDEADQNFSNSIDGMINQAEIQYMKRNISLLEFLDMYTSYKDSYIAIIEAKNQLLQSAIQLNVHVGRDVIKLNY